MAQNKIFSSIFGEKAKERKLLKQLKKLKKQYDILNEKFKLGKINNKELDTYYKLQEEINKMGKKMILKNGKLTMKTEDNEELKMEEQNINIPPPPTPLPVNQIQPPVNQIQPPIEQVQPQVVEAHVPTIEERMKADEFSKQQEQAQMQAQMQARQEQQYMQQQAHIRAQQNQAEQQFMQQQEQVRAQQQEQVDAQRIAQSQFEDEHPQQIPSQTVRVFVSEVPDFKFDVDLRDMKAFIIKIDAAMINGTKFVYGPNNINGSKILLYRFE